MLTGFKEGGKNPTEKNGMESFFGTGGGRRSFFTVILGLWRRGGGVRILP